MKFSSSYDHEVDHFGDSCGSAEEQSEEGSDSEQEEQVDTVSVDVVNAEPQYEYIVKEEILSDLDVEVGAFFFLLWFVSHFQNNFNFLKM